MAEMIRIHCSKLNATLIDWIDAKVGKTETIDTKNDRILWNSDEGNCFVRSLKWKRLVAEQFASCHKDMYRYDSQKAKESMS